MTWYQVGHTPEQANEDNDNTNTEGDSPEEAAEIWAGDNCPDEGSEMTVYVKAPNEPPRRYVVFIDRDPTFNAEEDFETADDELTQEFKDEALILGGRDLYASEYADEFEEHGGRFPSGSEITSQVPWPPDDRLLPIMRRYEKQLGDAWKRSVWDVGTRMGLETTKEFGDMIYYTLMGCRGHGIGLTDEFEDEVRKYEDSGVGTLDSTPFHTELTDLRELAYELLAAPEVEYGVFNEAGELAEGRFHDRKTAETWIKEKSAEGCTVGRVEK